MVAKDNPADSNIKEDVVSSSSAANPQQVNPLEGLLNLLVDLRIVDRTEEPPREALPDKKEEAGVVEGLSKQLQTPQLLEEQRQPPCQGIVTDRKTKEDFVSSSSEPTPETVAPDASKDGENSGFSLEIRQQGRHKTHAPQASCLCHCSDNPCVWHRHPA